MRPVKVLVVDDSALVRQLLTELLQSAPGIVVVGSAPDPYVARERIKRLQPDVLTLDVEMPRMDGISFLRNLMRLRPMPVIMVSSLTERGAEVTLQALELGAVDFVTKPKLDVASGLAAYRDELVEKVRAAAAARVGSPRERPAGRAEVLEVVPRFSADAVLKADNSRRHFRTTEAVLAIGASTGGTEAIKEVLAALPPEAPGIVVTQHIPHTFSRAFAERMNRVSRMRVKEAEEGDAILPGHVLIAPGDRHLMVRRSGARYLCELSDGAAVNRHRPSVDVLFRSVAQQVGPNAVAMLLTGMGVDGARGMAEIRAQGGRTLAQDEATSVVWGMPGEAVRLGAVEQVLPLARIPAAALELASARPAGEGRWAEGA